MWISILGLALLISGLTNIYAGKILTERSEKIETLEETIAKYLAQDPMMGGSRISLQKNRVADEKKLRMLLQELMKSIEHLGPIDGE